MIHFKKSTHAVLCTITMLVCTIFYIFIKTNNFSTLDSIDWSLLTNIITISLSLVALLICFLCSKIVLSYVFLKVIILVEMIICPMSALCLLPIISILWGLNLVFDQQQKYYSLLLFCSLTQSVVCGVYAWYNRLFMPLFFSEMRFLYTILALFSIIALCFYVPFIIFKFKNKKHSQQKDMNVIIITYTFLIFVILLNAIYLISIALQNDYDIFFLILWLGGTPYLIYSLHKGIKKQK